MHAGRRALLSLLLIGLGTAMFIDRANNVEAAAGFSMLAWKWLPLLVIVAGLARLILFARQPWELVQPTVIVTIAIFVLAGIGLVEPVSPLPTDRYVPLLWPTTVILTGIWLLIPPPSRQAATQATDDVGELRIVLWLRGETRQSRGVFASGRIRVVMGYLQLDMRGSTWNGRSPLDVTVFLGHVRILVPPEAPFVRHPTFVLTHRGLRYRQPPVEPEHQMLLRVSVIGVGGDAVVQVSQPDDTRHASS
jgi:hypothetical protein